MTGRCAGSRRSWRAGPDRARAQGRFHTFDFTLTPYYGTKALSFKNAQKTLALDYVKTRLFTDRESVPVSGADGLAIRAANATFGDPILPIPCTFPRSRAQRPILSVVPSAPAENHIALDPEGIVQNADGRCASHGTMCQTDPPGASGSRTSMALLSTSSTPPVALSTV